MAQSLAVGRATISEYFRRADVEGLRWPLPADLSDAELERRLFPYSRGEARRAVPQPDWAYGWWSQAGQTKPYMPSCGARV